MLCYKSVAFVLDPELAVAEFIRLTVAQSLTYGQINYFHFKYPPSVNLILLQLAVETAQASINTSAHVLFIDGLGPLLRQNPTLGHPDALPELDEFGQLFITHEFRGKFLAEGTAIRKWQHNFLDLSAALCQHRNIKVLDYLLGLFATLQSVGASQRTDEFFKVLLALLHRCPKLCLVENFAYLTQVCLALLALAQLSRNRPWESQGLLKSSVADLMKANPMLAEFENLPSLVFILSLGPLAARQGVDPMAVLNYVNEQILFKKPVFALEHFQTELIADILVAFPALAPAISPAQT